MEYDPAGKLEEVAVLTAPEAMPDARAPIVAVGLLLYTFPPTEVAAPDAAVAAACVELLKGVSTWT